MRGFALSAALALAALATLAPLPAGAAELRMAVRTDASSIDPHYHVYTPNSAVFRHVFDTLTQADARGRIRPGLATRWTAVAADVWEFTLRPGVTFHDGTAFTADDVAFSLARAPNVPNSPSSYAQYTKLVARAEVVDPLTIRVHTRGPAPPLPVDMSAIAIVSRRAAEGRATSDFNGGAVLRSTSKLFRVCASGSWLP